MTGNVIRGYRLIERLGRGGTASVYKASRVTDGALVAVKVLASALTDDSRHRATFRREGELGARLRHEHLVRVLDGGEEDGLPFMVLEYVDGAPLGRWLRQGPLAEGEVVRLGKAVAGALQYLHAAGLIHGDVKPGNILLGRDGQVKLTDPVYSTEAAATPAYAAPERMIHDSGADIRSDIYALGATLYRALCARLPFGNGTPEALLRRKLSLAVTPAHEARPDISLALSEVIGRMLAPQAADRYATPDAVLVALASLSEKG